MFKLMIVDDSNIVRNKIKRTIDNGRFQLVATACNGIDAVEKFKLHRPDVVTMDLTMPEMDGIDCIQKLASINPDVLILVISALSDKATGIEALSRGAQGFLLKPFSESDLVRSLYELTDTSHD